MVLSLLASGAYALLERASQAGHLPFGFQVEMSTTAGSRSVHSAEVEPTSWPGKTAASGKVSIRAHILSLTPRVLFARIGDRDGMVLNIDGQTVPLVRNRFFSSFPVHRGISTLVIRGHIQRDHFRLLLSRNSMRKWPLPFYQVLQADAPRFPILALALLITILDCLRGVGFLLAILLVLFRIVRQLPWDAPPQPRLRFSWALALTEWGAIWFSLTILSLFAFQQLRHPPRLLPVTLGASLLATVLVSLRLRSVCRSRQIPWRHLGTLLAIVGFVLLSIWAVGGRMLPGEPVSCHGDMCDHLKMIQSAAIHGDFNQDGDSYRIYPQAIHFLLARFAVAIHLEPEVLLTYALMALFVAYLFAAWLLADALFPGVPPAIWILAFGLARWPYIQNSLFILYSFPSVSSTTFFLFSIYLLRRSAHFASSLSLAAALASYPYFALPYLLGYTLFELAGKGRIRFRPLWKVAMQLTPAIMTLAWYTWNYMRLGVPQQQQGFLDPTPWSPLTGLGLWNTIPVLIVLTLMLRDKLAREYLGLILGVSLAFLAYVWFSSSSNYYLMKNANLFLPLGIMAIAFGLNRLWRRLPRRRWAIPAMTLGAGLLIAVQLAQRANLRPFHPPVGITSLNRFLLANSRPGEVVAIVTRERNPQWRMYFQLTLEQRRPLIMITDLPGSGLVGKPKWVLLNHEMDGKSRDLGRGWNLLRSTPEISLFRSTGASR